jgi:hypothetical protein
MFKSAIWKFSNPSVRSTYEAMLSPRNADSLLLSSQEQSGDGLTEPVAKLVGQRFSIAFGEELHRRDLVAERMAMRTFICTEKLDSGRSRTRVELDVIIDVPRATQNELIDALGVAKRKCSAWAGPHIKILLKAELKTGRLGLRSLTKSSR